jgi:hypothetical protein
MTPTQKQGPIQLVWMVNKMLSGRSKLRISVTIQASWMGSHGTARRRVSPPSASPSRRARWGRNVAVKRRDSTAQGRCPRLAHQSTDLTRRREDAKKSCYVLRVFAASREIFYVFVVGILLPVIFLPFIRANILVIHRGDQ